MGPIADPSVLAACAVASAGVAGASLGTAWARVRRTSSRRRRARSAFDAGGEASTAKSADARVLDYAVSLSRRLALGATAPLLRRSRFRRIGLFLEAHAKKAGLEKTLTTEGFAEASLRLGACAAGIGALVGAVFSTELSLLCAVGGGIAGASAPPRAVCKAEGGRVAKLERDLSEMLEVVSLGLRSGLSFDRSFELYGEHFDSAFARECALARRSWLFGLATREEALRALAASYDSPLLARAVESVVRSLRFGSSLAETLESAAEEARSVHRAHVEERVAKAPVKMMVPTGTLILPAMLLLVLGPVLLELMEGF